MWNTREERMRIIDNKVEGFTNKSDRYLKRTSISSHYQPNFVEASEKCHNDTYDALRDQQAALRDQQTTLWNQQSSIFNIMKKVGQFAQLLHERLPGTLSSNTEVYPRVHVLAVTTQGSEKY